MNKVREAAGLPKFVENTQLLPSEAPKTPDDFWEKLCAKVRGVGLVATHYKSPSWLPKDCRTAQSAHDCSAFMHEYCCGLFFFIRTLQLKLLALPRRVHTPSTQHRRTQATVPLQLNFGKGGSACLTTNCLKSTLHPAPTRILTKGQSLLLPFLIPNPTQACTAPLPSAQKRPLSPISEVEGDSLRRL